MTSKTPSLTSNSDSMLAEDFVDVILDQTRRTNGLSARQLAAQVDVAPSTVTRIESGEASPSLDLAQEILSVWVSRSDSPGQPTPQQSQLRGDLLLRTYSSRRRTCSRYIRSIVSNDLGLRPYSPSVGT